MRGGLTPGEWKFEPGQPGFMGNLEEPPEEPYPPVIYIEEDDTGYIELAQLCDPIPECASVDPYSGEPDREGDAHANGRLMAASKDLRHSLREVMAVLKDKAPWEYNCLVTCINARSLLERLDEDIR